MGRTQPHTLSHFLRYYTRHNSSQTAGRIYLNIKFLKRNKIDEYETYKTKID